MEMNTRKSVLFATICLFLVITVLYKWELVRRQAIVNEIPIMVFHDVTEIGAPSRTNVSMDVEHFSKKIDELWKENFSTVSFENVYEYATVRKWSLPEKPVIVSFDDTWKGQSTLALPILTSKKFSATFFINSGWVESAPDMMSWDDVRALHEAGMEIGGHTVHHTELDDFLSEKELFEEVKLDKDQIEKELGESITTFAYPYNTATERTIRVLKNVGYKTARTAGDVISGGDTDLYLLKGSIYE